MAERKGKAPAKTEEAGVPAQYDYGPDAGAGNDQFDANDFLVPIVRVLQPLSPQVDEGDEAYIEGASAGQFFIPATGLLIGREFPFIPVMKDRAFVEFYPRETKKGFVGQLSVNDPRVNRLREEQGTMGKLVDEEAGTEISETIYIYGFGYFDGDWQQCVLAFSSTAITAYKQGFTPKVERQTRKGIPMFACVLNIGTKSRENSKGKFYTWTFELSDDHPLNPQSEIYESAKAFYESVKAGEVRADEANSEERSTDDDAASM